MGRVSSELFRRRNPFYWLAQLSIANLGLSLLFAPLDPLGIWLGLGLERWMPEKLFYRISYTILFATGRKLIYDVIRPWALVRPGPHLRYDRALATRTHRPPPASECR